MLRAQEDSINLSGHLVVKVWTVSHLIPPCRPTIAPVPLFRNLKRGLRRLNLNVGYLGGLRIRRPFRWRCGKRIGFCLKHGCSFSITPSFRHHFYQIRVKSRVHLIILFTYYVESDFLLNGKFKIRRMVHHNWKTFSAFFCVIYFCHIEILSSYNNIVFM